MKRRNRIIELITDPTKNFLLFFGVGILWFTTIANGVSELFWTMSVSWLQRYLGINNPLVAQAIALAFFMTIFLFIIYITPFSQWFKRRLLAIFRPHELAEVETNAKPLTETFPGLIAIMSPARGDRKSPAERAMWYHWNDEKEPHLRHCWLICTEQSALAAEILEKRLVDFGMNQKLQLHWGESYQMDDPKHPGERLSLHVPEPSIDDPIYIQNLVDAIYADAWSRYGLDESEIIADLTGGTKIMTVGMVFACATAARRLQYISQLEEQGFMEIDIAYKLVSQKNK